MKSKVPCLGVFLLIAIHISCSVADVQSIPNTSEEVDEKIEANIIENGYPNSKFLLNPCLSSPCGPHAKCSANNDGYTCQCLPNFVNQPPNCRPECSSNLHCINNMTCVEQRCIDPCSAGVCGLNAECRVDNHTPICECPKNSTGDPFMECSPQKILSEVNPCNPNPCGMNTKCREENGVASCLCLPDFYGNPEKGCMPKCSANNDCPSNFMCIQNECHNPCPGICPKNSECLMENHLPTCTCKEGFTGDAYQNCTKIEQKAEKTDPCRENPCGPNSQCKNIRGIAACSCLPQFNGTPPNCTSECESSSECDAGKACIKQKCVNPCLSSTCGMNANCTVVNHSPLCTCVEGFGGDPVGNCRPLLMPPFVHPCTSSPCGPNSECQSNGMNYTCQCMPNYVGSPPNCKPECLSNAECASHLSCIDERCKDPCEDDICGNSANCHVANHTPICKCPKNYTGDPFVACTLDVTTSVPLAVTASVPLAVTASPPQMRKECVLYGDCPEDKACFNNKCIDPCKEACGIQAECTVEDHFAVCSCAAGYTGEPLIACHRIPPPVLAKLEQKAAVEFIAWFRSETTIFSIWKSLESNDSLVTDYRVAIEPPDARGSVLYVKKDDDPSKFYEVSFDGLVPGRLYNVSIQSKSGDSLSPPTVASYRTVPAKPLNVTLDEDLTTSTSFKVDWEAPNNNTDFDEYEVTIENSFELFQQYVSRTGDVINSFGTRNNVEPGQTYHVTVKTVSGNVTSWPETLNVTTKPLAVVNLQSAMDFESGSVGISWMPNEASSQNEYQISYHDMRNTNLGRASNGAINTNQTSYVLESLLPSRNYSVSVQAISNHVASEKSTIYVLTPPSSALMYL